MELNKNNLPRGIRNNNPANIVRSGSHWFGLCFVQRDKRFCQFTDMMFGVRAFFVLARTYRRKYGIKSVRAFIERFAPSKENNVESYVKYILKDTVLSGNCGFLLIDNDYDILLYKIICYENGFTLSDMVHFDLCIPQLRNIREVFKIKIC